jgi:anti-anti-sigma factor
MDTVNIITKELKGIFIVEPQRDLLNHLLLFDLKNILAAAERDNKVNIVLNMSKVKHLGSPGLGLVISAVLSLKKKGGTMRLCNVCSSCMENLVLFKLDQRVDIFKSEDEAVDSFSTAK